MGGIDQFIAVLFSFGVTGFIILLILISLVSNRFWMTQKLVLRGHYIGFAPLADGAEVNGFARSPEIVGLTAGEPVYAVIIGRPAGLINFLREGIGLARRFEFVLSKGQVITRYNSLTRQDVQCAKLSGLEALHIKRQGPNPLSVLMVLLVSSFIFGGIFALLIGNSEGIVGGLWLGVPAALLYYWTQRVMVIEFKDPGKAAVQFHVYPPLLERLSGRPAIELPLEDGYRLIQIFRVLKDA
jgi:hypothetical protein